MRADTLRLVVEIEPGEPVSGAAAREGEAPIRFEGMLAFLSLFDRLRRPAGEAELFEEPR